MTSMDDKSAYDNILMSDNSYKYMGFEWAGYYLFWKTLPFGFKLSAFIYQTAAMAATSIYRDLGVPSTQYIDDRLIGQLQPHLGNDILYKKESKFPNSVGNAQRAESACYVVACILTELGFFMAIPKCVFSPCQEIKYLGFLVDSISQSFRLPKDKKLSFLRLRDEIQMRR